MTKAECRNSHLQGLHLFQPTSDDIPESLSPGLMVVGIISSFGLCVGQQLVQVNRLTDKMQSEIKCCAVILGVL